MVSNRIRNRIKTELEKGTLKAVAIGTGTQAIK
jgi:hypothetical protein